MMLYPAMNTLNEYIPNRYMLVNVVARRARQLAEENDDLLNEREKEIMVLRYGLGKHPPKTQREVATLLGISRSYVSRIEKKVLALLREKLGEEAPDFKD